MIIAKGVEIIPKRDKVTIASNILGKWEDYSIDTYQGKVLKEAADRFKVLLKSGSIPEADVVSLKEQLNKKQIPVQKEEDFWSMPAPVESVVVPEAESTAVNLLEKVHEDIDDTVKSLAPEEVIGLQDDDGKRYIIKAYVNKKNDRQMYLASWDDSNDWLISAVAYPTTRARCDYLINKAQKQIEKANAEKTIRSRFPSDLKFEIVEVQ